ncbi:L-rhamnose mutarotase [Chryseobacterium indoltheticum]|uniref:L-rhamnose mutarotase n=1 Tax=Chryseobacterium indoltheticum TaxID=254 RepID=A0A3G6N2Y6_9FLAO|nr:L-rhamnose mutarotase [Chryseobacterium indoltheticum]AZA60275.1 L-rhamnose mutarotase [Chryseobacterium indoltheticum]
MKKFCLALDLIDDSELIAEYEKYHQNVWPEIKQSILDAGIKDMEIYRVQNRLFMIIEADENFSFEAKNEADKYNSKVQEWEELMWKFQQQLPNSKPDEKWQLMDKIFSL